MNATTKDEIVEIVSFQELPSDPLVEEMRRASKSGDLELVENVLNRRKEEQSKFLNMSLDGAIEGKQVDIVRWLVGRGAQLELYGGTQAGLAITTRSLETLETMYQLGWRPGEDNLIHAVSARSDEILVWLLDQGVRPRQGGVLDVAADVGSIQTVDILFQKGVKIEDGMPLHSAAMRPGRIHMMRHLVKNGADVNGPDYTAPRGDKRGPPLVYASCTGNLEAVRWLLEHGATESLDDDGKKLCMEYAWRYCRDQEVLSSLEKLLTEFETRDPLMETEDSPSSTS